MGGEAVQDIYTPRELTTPDEGRARVRVGTPDVNWFAVQLANHNAEFLLRHPAARTEWLFWNFGSQTICTTLDVVIRTSCPILILVSQQLIYSKLWKPDNLHYACARCCDKDFLSNTDIGQPTAQNTAYIPSAALFLSWTTKPQMG